MIGMVNVPCDSPIDFYAAPHRSESPPVCKDFDDVPKTPTKRTPSYRPLFMSNRKKIVYAQDGRKYSDGVALEVCVCFRIDRVVIWGPHLLSNFVSLQ
ncbi:hypothetical protein ANCCAN_14349 [Ancylostoma caninum]|uniref:Uncharacterized protein n=1 Tax=Ancylostoma caninum TaxID=29170 RepID=A0A368G7R7_ANCCA|nr:hypothetical protein ANCCAN_14349 [Ancylostoma caninum]